MTKKSDAPAIRFKGFSDAWEQRKFEEIAVRSSVICSDDTLPRVEYEDIVSGTGRLNKDITAILDFIRFTPFDNILPDENCSDKGAF